MNPNLTSTKFQLATLISLVGILSPFVAGVNPLYALIVVAVVIIAYMYFNVQDKQM